MGRWWNSLFGLFFLFSLLGGSAFAQYELEMHPALGGCPFQHSDSYQFDGLLGILKNQLENKVKSNAACIATAQGLSDSLTRIDEIFDETLKPGVREELTLSTYEQRLSELRLQKLEMELDGVAPDSLEFVGTVGSIQALESAIVDLEVEFKLAGRQDGYQSTQRYKGALIGHVKTVLSTVGAADPKCIDQIGGWGVILPALATTASIATGYSGVANSAVIGGAMDAMASLGMLLKDLRSKLAVRRMIRNQNSKVLACTYFAMKYASCNYRRAFRLGQDRNQMTALIRKRFAMGPNGQYEKYFYFRELSTQLDPIFDAIGTAGTALTLNLELIIRYFVGKRATADLPDPPAFDASNIEKRRWIAAVKIRGLQVAENGPGGTILPVDEQIEDAKQRIAQRKADIGVVEQILQSERSFRDLRHSLDSADIVMSGKLRELDSYLEALEGSNPNDGYPIRIPSERIGAIRELRVLLGYLEEFLAVSLDSVGNDFDAYEMALKEKGTLVFGAMANGAVAQLSQQTALALGSIARQRVARAFDVVEQVFLLRDVQGKLPDAFRYSLYKQEREIVFDVIRNYADVSGAGTTFRVQDFEAGFDSFEKGFRREIRRSLNRALFKEPQVYGLLRGKTARHLCSLYSSALKKTLWGRHLLDVCRRGWYEMDLMAVYGREYWQTDFDDECDYVDYYRELQTQNLLYHQDREWKASKGLLNF